MTNELKPNALAKRLDKVAKSGGSTAGLPDNQRQYVLAVQRILSHYRSGKYTRDIAASERKGAQIRFLQHPLIQEDVERWTHERLTTRQQSANLLPDEPEGAE